MGERYVIFSGGRLGPWALREIKEGDILIGADRGALFLIEYGIIPDYAMGDFDSVTTEQKERIRSLCANYIDCDPIMKDLTDTEMALNWAAARNPGEIVLCGAIGSRFDHSLSNVQLLKKAADLGIQHCTIHDEYNRLSLATPEQPLTIQPSRFTYVSLLPLLEVVSGITLTGFQYPLHNATLRMGNSLAISNRLQAEKGLIQVGAGILLVIESVD